MEALATDQFSALFVTRDSDELEQFQRDSYAAFQRLGLPGRKSEAYKYTPIEKILSKNFEQYSTNDSTAWTKEEILSSFYDLEEGNHLVFINGSYEAKLSLIKSQGSDLEIRPIDRSDINLLGKVSNQSQDPFAQLNGGLFQNGLSLTAKANKQNIPTFIYHFIDTASNAAFPRILISAHKGSDTKVFEKTFVKGETPVFVNALVESNVEMNAVVRFTKLRNYAKNLFTVEGIYANQERDSRFYTNTFSFSGSVIRNNIVIDVNGENCEAHMHGLYLLNGKTHVDNNTSVDHLKPNSYSNELYKGVIDESAKGVFNGKIYVRPDAQKTNAFQANNNIILADTATVNTKPQLEIWADDVKCSHGCTTGQLDEEALFYLRSRGISKQRAKALMLNAFANEALNEIQVDLVKEEVEGIINSKLG